MKVVIDTSSLLSLVRYYLPFDKNLVLFNFIKERIATGEIVILDAVLTECKYVSNGEVLKSLTYLADKSFLKANGLPINTKDILPPAPQKFYRQLDNQFVIGVVKNTLTPVEYESMRADYLNQADMKLILFCLNLKKDNPLFEDTYIVTEETERSNDSKVFKKIPAICKELGIKTLNLPQLLEKYNEIKLEIK